MILQIQRCKREGKRIARNKATNKQIITWLQEAFSSKKISQDEFTSIVQHQYLWHPHKVKFITSLTLIIETWKRKK